MTATTDAAGTRRTTTLKLQPVLRFARESSVSERDADQLRSVSPERDLDASIVRLHDTFAPHDFVSRRFGHSRLQRIEGFFCHWCPTSAVRLRLKIGRPHVGNYSRRLRRTSA